MTWLEDEMIPYYPLGVIKEPAKQKVAETTGA